MKAQRGSRSIVPHLNFDNKSGGGGGGQHDTSPTFLPGIAPVSNIHEDG